MIGMENSYIPLVEDEFFIPSYKELYRTLKFLMKKVMDYENALLRLDRVKDKESGAWLFKTCPKNGIDTSRFEIKNELLGCNEVYTFIESKLNFELDYWKCVLHEYCTVPSARKPYLEVISMSQEE